MSVLKDSQNFYFLRRSNLPIAVHQKGLDMLKTLGEFDQPLDLTQRYHYIFSIIRYAQTAVFRTILIVWDEKKPEIAFQFFNFEIDQEVDMIVTCGIINIIFEKTDTEVVYLIDSTSSKEEFVAKVLESVKSTS